MLKRYCTQCNKLSLKQSICFDCREKNARIEANKNRTEKHCINCLEPTIGGRLRCEDCRKERVRERKKKARERDRLNAQRKVDTRPYGKKYKSLVTDPLEYILRRCLSCGGVVKARDTDVCEDCKKKSKFNPNV